MPLASQLIVLWRLRYYLIRREFIDMFHAKNGRIWTRAGRALNRSQFGWCCRDALSRQLHQ